MLPANNTLVIPLKVTVMGDPKTGKSTFLKCLQSNKQADMSFRQEDNSPFYDVHVKDFKNNASIVF